MSKDKLVKYLKGISTVLKVLSKEIDENGINDKDSELMKNIGSDLLFKGITTRLTKDFAVSLGDEK